jgi:indolepyruvate ferredoxin oxidoreductase
MAAHLQGKGASVLDFMGFAQKFGPVLSYIRISESPDGLNQVRIDIGQADALIGCDLVVSSSPKASRTYRAGHTRVVMNTTEMSTADFVRHRDASLRPGERIAAIEKVVGADNFSPVAANQLAERLLGNTIYANVLLLGYAWQKGLLPISLEALMRAVELNNVAIEKNKAAITWGRLAAENMPAIDKLIEPVTTLPVSEEPLVDAIRRRAEFLVGYQDNALSESYQALVARVRAAEGAVMGEQAEQLSRAVTKAWFKTLAYKDEYEVARLHATTAFLSDLKDAYGKKAKLRFHLAPPMLNSGIDARGRPRKREFGAWIVPAFRILAKFKGLRGTPFDVFGRSAERKMERALIVEFEQTIERLLATLDKDNIEEATAIVSCYLDIRGYGPVKEKAAAEVRADIETRLARFSDRTKAAA